MGGTGERRRGRVVERMKERRSWMTPPEVGKQLEVSGATVRSWCEAGALGHRVAGRWRITPVELREFELHGLPVKRR